MANLRWAAPLLLTLLPTACTVVPDSQSGIQTKSSAFAVGGYFPNPPPFAVSIQQQDSSGNWVTTSSATAVDASQFLPNTTTWHPWAASFTPSSASTYWSDSSFGGIASTLIRTSVSYWSTDDVNIALDCAFSVPADSSGTIQPNTIAATCGDSSGITKVHTCRNGPSSSASSYDCGAAGYPGNAEHNDLAALTGVGFIDSSLDKITGRFTDTQRSSVRTYLQQRLATYGIAVQLDNFSGGANVIGSLGQNVSGPLARPILIGAHFDTSSEFNAGASDNGTGVAIVLDLANFISTLPSRNRPVFFAFFDLESQGLQGSSHFVQTSTGQQPWHSVHMFDMFGGTQNQALVKGQTPLTDCIMTMYNNANAAGAYNIQLTYYTAHANSDFDSFLNIGVPAVSVSSFPSAQNETDCIDNKPCGYQCGGNCATGNMCTPANCNVAPAACAACDSYQQINFEYLSSVSLLARQTLQRLLTGQDTSCPG